MRDSVRLLDASGVMLQTFTQPARRIVTFSSDGSRLLTDNVSTVSILNTVTGATVLQPPPRPTMKVGEAALSDSAKTLAVLYVLDAEVPSYTAAAYPTQYLLAIHRSSPVPLFTAVISRHDDTLALAPPVDLGTLIISDDGAFALVAFPRHLAVFSLGSEPS